MNFLPCELTAHGCLTDFAAQDCLVELAVGDYPLGSLFVDLIVADVLHVTLLPVSQSGKEACTGTLCTGTSL